MDDAVKVTQTRHGESLDEVRESFKCWREGRGRGEHIPRELWAAAVGIAREHGLPVAARELQQLDSDRLKRRQQAQGEADRPLPESTSRSETQFVELTVAANREPGNRVRCECAIELENTRGTKMRVELNGQGLASLAGLCRAFWSAA
jgi:hypothetical protein